MLIAMQFIFFLADAADNAAGTLFGIGTFGLILAILASVFWIWMLIDALTNKALDSTMKIIWAVVIFFLHILGALIYFFVGRKTQTRV